MEIHLGRFPCQLEKPEPVKFAWPVLLLPELFTGIHHLRVLAGYLATIGWEVYAPDLRSAAGQNRSPALGQMRFQDLLDLAAEALQSLDRPAIVWGHGMGGVLALKLAETGSPKAVVAMAPLIPGFKTPLVFDWRRAFAHYLKKPLQPPSGRVLFELLLDVEPFVRPAMAKALVVDAGPASWELISGKVSIGKGGLIPRVIVAGQADPFVPIDRAAALAASTGAKLVTVPGRGHWLIGGRGMERTVGEAHRFLVRALGADLLLLYPEEWKEDPSPP